MTNALPWIAALALLASACASSPQATFYTLAARQPQERPQAAGSVRISIDSVSVPDLVDRPQIVTRVDATQVNIEEFARWADPLEAQITRVLAADLAQSVPGALASGNLAWEAADETYHVSVDILSFESAPGSMASIAALWTVRALKSGEPVSGRSMVHEPTDGQGYDALVQAHSRALAMVSSDIARAIETMRVSGGKRPVQARPVEGRR